MQLLQCRNADIHYTQLDAAPGASSEIEIVLVHGLATNMAFWYSGVAMAMSKIGRVTVLDLRGHGKSSMPDRGYTADEMSEDVLDLLNELNIDRAHLIGHSYGALVASAFAVRECHRIASLTLADMRIPLVQPRLTFRQAGVGVKMRQMLAESDIVMDPDEPEVGLALLTHIARLKTMSHAGAERLEKAFINAGRVMGRRAAQRWLTLVETTSAYDDFRRGSILEPEDLRGVDAPIYGLYGAKSMNLQTGRALRDALPKGRFETMADAGHFFPSSRPKEFVLRTLRFLAEDVGMRPVFAERAVGAFAGASSEAATPPHRLH